MSLSRELLGRLIDIVSGQRRSVNSLIESGGWFFKQVDTYTESSPLTIADGVKHKLIIPLNDTGLSKGKYFDLSYDPNSHLFLPKTPDDLYLANVRMECKPDSQGGHLDLTIECPSVSYNPINGDTLTFNKSSGEEQFFSPNLILFIGQDLVDNGLEVFLKPSGCDVELYDYSFTLCRLYSNKGN